MSPLYNIKYRPQGNGLVECQNRKMGDCIQNTQMKVKTGLSYWMAYSSLYVLQNNVQQNILNINIDEMKF